MQFQREPYEFFKRKAEQDSCFLFAFQTTFNEQVVQKWRMRRDNADKTFQFAVFILYPNSKDFNYVDVQKIKPPTTSPRA
jgi:hypothetical protein